MEPTSLKVESRPLSGTDLAEAWVREDSAAAFFPGDPGRMRTYRDRADDVDRRFDDGSREAAARHLTGGGQSGPARLRAFVEQDGFMVTTGQQPGLFGGPLHGLYKAMTAAALARRLEGELGRPVLPVFWVASEDHDWDEARSVHVLDPQNELHAVELPPTGQGAPTPPLHRVRAGPEVATALKRFLELHPDTDFSQRWLSILEEAYRPETGLAQAFGEVMGELLKGSGVFLLQAHDRTMKERSLPILLRELEESADRSDALLRRGEELRAAGFDLQVPLLDGATNLFLEGPAGRERLFREDGGFRQRTSATRLSFDEIRSRAEDDPTTLSPNVLLRPVVESALLPTLSYVAGPGEAAYLAQIAPVFEGHGIARPVVHPRMSLFVLERKVEKVLEKLNLEVEDLSRPPHELAGALARDDLPEAVQAAIGELKGTSMRGAKALERAAVELDPTLEGAVEAFRTRVSGLIEDVEKKIVQSAKRQNETTMAQAAKARAHLYPLGRPQERVLNPFYYLVRYDGAFLDALAGEAERAVLP